MAIIKPRLHHVTLKTSRLGEMIEWYRAVVGVEVNFRDEHNAWTSNDAANHRLAFLSVPGLRDDPDKARHLGLHHTAFEYASFANLMASYARLKGAGIRPAFCLDHGLTISLYYRDPEGNFVELQSDNFGDWAKSTEWMRTSPDFKANPIGTFFDPDQVYAAHEAGQPFEALQPAIRAGEFPPASVPNLGLPGPDAPEEAAL